MERTLQDADREARNIVSNWTTVGALAGWVPGSVLFLTGADIVMINQVANAYDVSAYDKDHLQEFLVGAVGGLVVGGVVSEAASFVPVIGWAVKGAGMAAKTKVIGQEVTKYFRERSPLPDTRLLIDVDLDDD